MQSVTAKIAADPAGQKTGRRKAAQVLVDILHRKGVRHIFGIPASIDIGRPSRAFPVTPPCVRVRTRRFSKKQHQRTSAGRPRESKNAFGSA